MRYVYKQRNTQISRVHLNCFDKCLYSMYPTPILRHRLLAFQRVLLGPFPAITLTPEKLLISFTIVVPILERHIRMYILMCVRLFLLCDTSGTSYGEHALVIFFLAE